MAQAVFRHILFLALAFSVSVPVASGSSSQDLLHACLALTDNVARLSCYDNTMETNASRPDPRALDNEALLEDTWYDEKDGSLLDSRWELRKGAKRGVFLLRPYKPVYLAPFSWTNKRNKTPSTPNLSTTVTQPQELNNFEAEFQLSLKFKMAEGLFGRNYDLWGAYTQSSRWQSYNDETSRPFRETNYEPEVLLVTATNYSVLGWRGRLLGFGLNHQSNGRDEPFSRSWNRVILFAGFEREGWATTVRVWQRISDFSSRNDNPDMPDYLGRFDVTVVRVLGDHQFSLMARHSLKTGNRSHGAAQLEWAFPIHAPLRGRVQLFHGYGESQIDYNFKATWISLGLSMVEWY